MKSPESGVGRVGFTCGTGCLHLTELKREFLGAEVNRPGFRGSSDDHGLTNTLTLVACLEFGGRDIAQRLNQLVVIEPLGSLSSVASSSACLVFNGLRR